MSPPPDQAPVLTSTATRHAARLLADLGLPRVRVPMIEAPAPDLDWARSGCARLSGPAPAPVAACMRGAWAAFEALAPTPLPTDLDPAALLGERAALAGLEGRGRTTVGGAGRLVRIRDGWLAVQLPRPEDVAAVPAWLECEPPVTDGPEVLDRVERLVATRDGPSLVERARLLGLAVSRLPAPGAPGEVPIPWLQHVPPSVAGAARLGDAPRRRLRVLDLSTLWAGPLCGRLLGRAGADVVKVEHPRRIDGARLGPPAFFDAMNAAKSMLALDATTEPGRTLLLDLIAVADVVIESARPRGLAQLGIEAQALVDTHPGLTWISITGYGRTPPRGEWVAFGDDAAVAAGLVGSDHSGEPIFCGDAIADPLTGVHAAAAALAGARLGGGLFDVPLAGVARTVRETPFAEGRPAVEPGAGREPHAARAAEARRARGVGADTSAVLARWLGHAPEPPGPC